MTGWDKEYLDNKEEYLELFDTVMQKEQETNIEFLEKSLSKKFNRVEDEMNVLFFDATHLQFWMHMFLLHNQPK